MDTLTHALSGALLARATAPRMARVSVSARVAAGFCAAALPDIDFVLSYVSPEAYVTGHRGATHSMFLLPLWALLAAWICAKVDRTPGLSARDYYVVCALAIGAHIVGDLITSFGTMVYAPFSATRIAWSMTFVIDLWFTSIILAGLVASWARPRSRVPAILGLAALGAYVGLQGLAHARAIDFGTAYAAQSRLDAARVSAFPRPVSPFNWMVVVAEDERYHYANVNLMREELPAAPGPNAGLIARLDAAYVPLARAPWTTVEKYGPDPALRSLAARALNDPQLEFFRSFADYPALFRVDRGNPTTCVWFQDLRFVLAGRDLNLFRFGLCREEGSAEWRAFRLRDDGAREPAR